MRKAMAAAVLCLLLSACGGGGDGDASGGLLGRAAGLDESETLLVIDGREIPAWQYLYWLAEDCRQLEERCEAAGTAPDWSAPAEENGTLAELVKADALADTVLYAVVDSWAEVYDCTLTEEELGNLPKRSYAGLTEAQSLCLAETGRKYAKLYALYETPGSPLAPAEGELALFQETAGPLAAEQIPVPAGSGREAARQQAEALFARLNAAEDQAAAFETLMEETDGGLLSGEGLSDDLRAAANALKPGEISGILETAEGFSILRRLPTEESVLREAYFDSLLQDAAAAAEIQCTNAYFSLQSEAFWSAFKATESIT